MNISQKVNLFDSSEQKKKKLNPYSIGYHIDESKKVKP